MLGRPACSQQPVPSSGCQLSLAGLALGAQPCSGGAVPAASSASPGYSHCPATSWVCVSPGLFHPRRNKLASDHFISSQQCPLYLFSSPPCAVQPQGCVGASAAPGRRVRTSALGVPWHGLEKSWGTEPGSSDESVAGFGSVQCYSPSQTKRAYQKVSSDPWLLRR